MNGLVSKVSMSDDLIKRMRRAINYARYLLACLEVLPSSSQLTSETIQNAVAQAQNMEYMGELTDTYITLAVILVEMKGGDMKRSDEAEVQIKKFWKAMEFRFL